VKTRTLRHWPRNAICGRAISRWYVGAACCVGSTCWASPGHAETLEARHPASYYVLHGGLTLAGFAGGWASSLLAPYAPGAEFLPNFPPDVSVRSNFSPSAARLSDGMLWATIGVPALAQLYDGFDVAWANAELVYAEAHSASFLLTQLTKFLVRRPRPYTHSELPEARALAEGAGSEAWVSFFSGHSSASYTAAMSGSILFALRTDNAVARHSMFGLEFALAAFTAQLRVRAGRHYRTDVWLGSLVGVGIGLAVPALHGLPLSRVHASEWLTGAGAAAATIALSEAVDVCATLHFCSPEEVSRGGASASRSDSVAWALVPQAWPAGVAALAVF